MQYIVFIAITFLSPQDRTNFYQISTHSCYMLRSVNMLILNEYDEKIRVPVWKTSRSSSFHKIRNAVSRQWPGPTFPDVSVSHAMAATFVATDAAIIAPGPCIRRVFTVHSPCIHMYFALPVFK